MICTQEHEPVCGSNGETYPNKCMFESDRLCENVDGNLTIVFYRSCKSRFKYVNVCPNMTNYENVDIHLILVSYWAYHGRPNIYAMLLVSFIAWFGFN